MLPFLKQETVQELLCECCGQGNSEAVLALLENFNVSVNCMSYGGTPLYAACYAHSPECVELLLKRGADPNEKSDWLYKNFLGRRGKLNRTRDNPRTPLHALVIGWGEENHIACYHIFRMILKAGADLESKDGTGGTALLTMFWEHGIPSQKAVRSLLEAGADVSVTKDGDAILYRFLKNNADVKLLRLLLKHGCSVEDRGDGGKTVLHAALSRSSMARDPNSVEQVIECLLEKGARSDLKDDSGRGVLELAINSRSCSLEVFRRLLQSCPDMNDRNRCLLVAERGSHVENVKFVQELIAAGVSVEAQDQYGRSPLLAHCGNEKLFDALLECGARFDAVDSNGRGVLHHFVCTYGGYDSAERLQKLVEKGFDPQVLDNRGNNLLHIAVPSFRGVKEDVDFIQKILNFAISVNAKNHSGQTPLMVHIKHCRAGSPLKQKIGVSLVDLFQNQTKGSKLDLDAQDGEGKTALHYAVARSEADVSRLLDAGADPIIVTKKGQSLLHLACSARKSNIVGYLLSIPTCREMIEDVDSSGKTALHEACASGRPESVYYLLSHGANVQTKDSSGGTPLHSCADFAGEQRLWSTVHAKAEEATRKQHNAMCGTRKRTGISRPTERDTVRVWPIIAALISAGADGNANDSDGLTPLERALSHQDGRDEMVEYLQSYINLGREIKNEDASLHRQRALRQPRSSIVCLPQELQQAVLKQPAHYLSYISLEDIDWIVKNGGNITGEQTGFTDGISLLHDAASLGLTEIIVSVGDKANFFDNADKMIKLIQTSQEHMYAECLPPVLQTACKRELSNLAMLETLLILGVDINAKAVVASPQWVPGPTALHCLAQAKYWWQIDAIKLLVSKGATIDEKNEEGETALHIACRGNTLTYMGDEERIWKHACAEVLLDLGANSTILDNAGRSCLDKASAAPEIIQTLLKRGGHVNTSALFAAIQRVNYQAVRVLLDEGVSVNSFDSTNSCQVHYEIKDQTRYALFCAAFPYPFNNNNTKDSVPLIKLLIERGADLYAPLNDRETLIHYVFEHGEYEIVCAFLDCTDRIDLDRKDQLGRTVFLAACNFTSARPGFRHKHWSNKEAGPIIKILGHKADFAAIDNDGRNALHHLLDNPDVENDHILEFLKHPVAKKLFKQRDKKDFTPFALALRTLRPAVCKALMEMGADLLEPDAMGATALHHIASQWLQVHEPRRCNLNPENHKPEFYECCEQLWQEFLDLGGDINVRDNKGFPPVFSYLASPPRDDYYDKDPNSCCHVGSFDKFLANADLTARNADGETALHIIARREKTSFTKDLHDRKLFEFMVGKGLDPLNEDKKGRSSVDFAAACGQKEILNLFQYSS